MPPSWIATAQEELRRQRIDSWLIYDFRGSNRVAARFLNGSGAILSRRIFLSVPSVGRPRLLVSVLEAGSLRAEDFEVRSYGDRASLETELRMLLPDGPVAMEYSPAGDIPYVSVVDAGTVELVRSLGGRPVSSAELLQAFAAWSPRQVAWHREAAASVMEVVRETFDQLRLSSGAGSEVRESEVQQWIAHNFDRRGLTYDHRAIVGFGPNAGDPHYQPRAGVDRALAPGDVILVDLFARLPQEGAPYGDVTWMGVYGEPSQEVLGAFEAVTAARDLGVRAIRDAWAEGRRPQGREIDRVVRDFLDAAGYGAAFVHRTGHSLGWRHTHGEAVHLDDFETRDVRTLRPGIGLTVEPGVYLPEFGIRSELNLVLGDEGPEVTTGEQRELERIPLGPHHRSGS